MWSKSELCELLISEKIELRNEVILEILPLRDLADNVRWLMIILHAIVHVI